MKQYKTFFYVLLLAFTTLTATGISATAQVPSVQLAQYSSEVVGVATFDPTDMPYRSVLAATASGELHEIFYGPTTPQQRGDSVIGYFSKIRAIAGFYAADDQFRIAIVGTEDGNLTEIYYHPYRGLGRSVIANFPASKIMSIAAYYNPSDQHRVVYVALADSTIWKVEYHPSIGIKNNFWTTLGQSGVGIPVALAVNQAAGGLERRLLISTHTGNLYEYRLNNQNQMLSATLLIKRGTALKSVATNGYITWGVSPTLGAGVVNRGRLNVILPAGVGFVAADTAGRNFNDFIWSRGGGVFTSNYSTY